MPSVPVTTKTVTTTTTREVIGNVTTIITTVVTVTAVAITANGTTTTTTTTTTDVTTTTETIVDNSDSKEEKGNRNSTLSSDREWEMRIYDEISDSEDNLFEDNEEDTYNLETHCGDKRLLQRFISKVKRRSPSSFFFKEKGTTQWKSSICLKEIARCLSDDLTIDDSWFVDVPFPIWNPKKKEEEVTDSLEEVTDSFAEIPGHWKAHMAFYCRDCKSRYGKSCHRSDCDRRCHLKGRADLLYYHGYHCNKCYKKELSKDFQQRFNIKWSYQLCFKCCNGKAEYEHYNHRAFACTRHIKTCVNELGCPSLDTKVQALCCSQCTYMLGACVKEQSGCDENIDRQKFPLP